MKRQLIQIVLITIIITIEFMACNTSQDTEPSYDPNNCAEYACPMHRDKMFVAPEICHECGHHLIRKDSINLMIKTITKSTLDSLDSFHLIITENANKIITNSKLSKKDQFKYLSEIIKNLNKAKIVNENLNQLVYGKQKLAFKNKHQKLERLYATASYRVTCISSELNKNNFNKEKVNLYTEELRKTIYEVDKEQHKIRMK